MKKIVITISIIVVTILVLFVGYATIANRRNAQKNLVLVPVKRGTIIKKAQAIGYIKPLHSNRVKSSVNGTVAELYHDVGDFVKKGEPLVRIHPEPEPSSYAAIYEAYNEAVINLKSAFKNYMRYKEALAAKIITRRYTDYINARNNYKIAQEKYNLAKQKLSLLEKGTTIVGNKTVANIVKSPINGYILSRNVDVGDPVISLSSAQASTTLFTMANMHNLMFEGAVDELDAGRIHLKMLADVTIGAQPNKPIKGMLTKIALRSDQENVKDSDNSKLNSNLPFNVSFSVQVTHLQIPSGLILRAGYSATADIDIKTAKNVLMIPERVLNFTDNDKVYVLLPSGNKQQPTKKQFITIGLTDGMNAEIKSGLKKGDKVVDTSLSDASKP
jgi:HlyD family secretion protein